jgi:hypothetical protein
MSSRLHRIADLIMRVLCGLSLGDRIKISIRQNRNEIYYIRSIIIYILRYHALTCIIKIIYIYLYFAYIFYFFFTIIYLFYFRLFFSFFFYRFVYDYGAGHASFVYLRNVILIRFFVRYSIRNVCTPNFVAYPSTPIPSTHLMRFYRTATGYVLTMLSRNDGRSNVVPFRR